jgi:hypothetical protein
MSLEVSLPLLQSVRFSQIPESMNALHSDVVVVVITR